MKSIAQILESAKVLADNTMESTGVLVGKTVSKSPEKFAEAKAIIKGLRRNFNKGYKKAKNEPEQMEFPFDDDIPF